MTWHILLSTQFILSASTKTIYFMSTLWSYRIYYLDYLLKRLQGTIISIYVIYICFEFFIHSDKFIIDTCFYFEFLLYFIISFSHLNILSSSLFFTHSSHIQGCAILHLRIRNALLSTSRCVLKETFFELFLLSLPISNLLML